MIETKDVKYAMTDSKPYIKASVIGIAANLLLFFVKLYVGISTNCISIYVDSLNNVMDSFVCLIAMIGFCLTVKKSVYYPFGLGRAEDLASFITAVVIMITGAAFGYVSLERTMYPAPVWYSTKYAFVIVITVVIKLLLGLYYRYKNKHYPSPVLYGLWIDSILDFFVTSATLMSFTLSQKLEYAVDGYFGLVISLMLFGSGVRACISSASGMLGKRDAEACANAKKLLEDDAEVAEVLCVECHKYGAHQVFDAQLHVCCATVQEVIDLEKRLQKQFEEQLSADLTVCIR